MLKLRPARFLRQFFTTGCILLALSQSLPVSAAAWVEAGDEQVRHHLQVLADAGLLNRPVTTWPLMWSGIGNALDGVDLATLSGDELWSYRYLKHELRRAQQRVSAEQQLYLASSHVGLTDFGSDSREQVESRSHAVFTGEHWAFKIQGSIVGDPIDGQRYRLDGSYIARSVGNWAVGFGAIDQWWGPGWQSSLILSNNARPSPGVFLNRIDNQPFDWPILRWLGPWDLRVFLNQLESNRATPEAKLFGMRATFKPLRQLEIGLSRTAQWGGEGRPQNLGNFWEMFIGNDNRGGGGIEEDGSNEPGNQLGGADWRLGHSFGGSTAAFYGQIIGEDEAGGLPSHVLGMAGLETSFMLGETHNRIALEASNTTMEFNKGGTPNVAYEHPRYPSGYRYRGRPLGASTDNDSEWLALKGIHNLVGGHEISWSLGTGNINADGGNRDAPGGNVFGAGSENLWHARADYALPISDNSRLSLGAQYYSESLEIRGEPIESGIYLTYKLRLQR
jgi:hypothetical protein